MRLRDNLFLKRLNWQRRVRPQARRLLPNWSTILEHSGSVWGTALSTKQNTKVLVATSTGGHYGVTPIESMLGAALTLRGANVHILLCDAALPACLQAQYLEFFNHGEFARNGPKRLCDECSSAGMELFAQLGLPIHRHSTLVTAEEREHARAIARSVPLEGVKQFQLDGLAIGEHALAGALRYFARGELSGERHAEAITRRYLEAALLTAFATRRLIATHGFEVAVFNHGIYVPHGVIGEVCRQMGVRVVNWHPAYRKQCYIFSHHDTYHHTLMDEPTTTWDQLDWTPELEQRTLGYLKSRWQGAQDWIKFHKNPNEDLRKIADEIGVDFTKPCIGLLTNVVWDAQLHYPANAHRDMVDWVVRTISYFAGRPELQLIIRVHPAEISGTLPSRQPIIDEISKAFPQLPPNVCLIGPESNVSTYAVMTQCDSVIIYGTKTGVELTSLGIPVIVAGEAWIRNKGVTIDAHSAAEYFTILDRLPLGRRMDEAQVQRARMYAYHFFFRRMIPLRCVAPAQGWPAFRVSIKRLDELAPEHDPGLDVICDGIVRGEPFVYPDEARFALPAVPAAL